MSQIKHLLLFEWGGKPSWKCYFHYLIRGILIVAAIFLVTGVIFILHLYPRISDVLIVYLLVILIVQLRYGFYTAIFGALVSCACVDFFLIPPLFTFSVVRIEEALGLLLFLAVTIMIGRLFSGLGESAKKATDREFQTRSLYESKLQERAEQLKHREFQVDTLCQLIRAINAEKELEHQLHLIMEAIVNVSSFYGVVSSAIFLSEPDEDDAALSLRVHAPRSANLKLSHDEEVSARWVLAHGQPVLLSEEVVIRKPRGSYIRRIIPGRTMKNQVKCRDIHLLPIIGAERVVGVLRLLIESEGETLPLIFESRFTAPYELVDSRLEFFWKFYDLALSVIERANMEEEKLGRRTQKLQDAIISSISHSLRTPLATIMGRATSLLQEDVSWDDKARRSTALNVIKREAGRLDRLVGKLLDMSCIQGGKLQPRKVLYPIEALIYETLEPGYMQDLLSGRSVSRDVQPDIPPVEVDPIRIGQVLENLLENAAHYTPSGSPIEIGAKVDGNYILISVGDHGPGIRSNQMESIFDKFNRGAMTYPLSTGIGLAVCRGVVEAHDGRIWVRNREGGGAVFQFTLPMTEGGKYE